MKKIEFSSMHKDEFNKKIGEYIKIVRTNHGLTQADLSSEMNINPQNISEIERGKVNPTMYWIDRMCNCIGLNPKDFYIGFYK